MTFLLLLLTLAPRAHAMPSNFPTVDAAAIAFVDLVRTYPEQRNERCAWLIKEANGRIRIGSINEGDMNRCPSQWPKPDGTVGSVHTHPVWGPNSKELGAAGQVFSEGDFAHGEYAGVPAFLGAPAGHVLRYDPGGSVCWGSSFIQRKFKIVRDLNPSVSGLLVIDPNRREPLFDLGGKPIPKPSYCKER